jgi:4-carboxymuconolactone decarboxylase
MGTHRSTPEDQLRALAAGQAAILEAMAQIQVGALERSNLDEETYLLVRLAALVVTDAGTIAYRMHLAGAGLPPISAAQVLATFAAIAPVVGSPRVLSAPRAHQGRIPPYRPLKDSSSHLGDAVGPGPGAVLAPVLDGRECSDGHDHQAAVP